VPPTASAGLRPRTRSGARFPGELLVEIRDRGQPDLPGGGRRRRPWRRCGSRRRAARRPSRRRPATPNESGRHGITPCPEGSLPGYFAGAGLLPRLRPFGNFGNGFGDRSKVDAILVPRNLPVNPESASGTPWRSTPSARPGRTPAARRCGTSRMPPGCQALVSMIFRVRPAPARPGPTCWPWRSSSATGRTGPPACWPGGGASTSA
jgi:hypothetical protein